MTSILYCVLLGICRGSRTDFGLGRQQKFLRAPNFLFFAQIFSPKRDFPQILGRQLPPTLPTRFRGPWAFGLTLQDRVRYLIFLYSNTEACIVMGTEYPTWVKNPGFFQSSGLDFLAFLNLLVASLRAVVQNERLK